METHTAYISIGSNIGDKHENCQKGITLLADSGFADIAAESSFYRTEPVDYKDQSWFINAVIQINTTFGPRKLFERLKMIEKGIGRTEEVIRFGPRVLDLDIIMYDDLVLETPGLTIPHPRMHKRRFVLKPFCDIAPQVIHPVLKVDMHHLLMSLTDKDQGVILYQ